MYLAPITIDVGANADAKGLNLRDPGGFTIELFEPASCDAERSERVGWSAADGGDDGG